MIRRLLPLAILLAVVIIAALGLRRDPTTLPSMLVNRKAPTLRAALLQDGHTAPMGELQAMAPSGQPFLVNVWASWCTACMQEHGDLAQLAASGVAIFGLNYKDDPKAAATWLGTRGNPYQAVFLDPQGIIGRDWGVYGVPETYLIDSSGVVRGRIVGPINAQTVRQQLASLSR